MVSVDHLDQVEIIAIPSTRNVINPSALVIIVDNDARGEIVSQWDIDKGFDRCARVTALGHAHRCIEATVKDALFWLIGYQPERT